jgi:hypothetical protein
MKDGRKDEKTQNETMAAATDQMCSTLETQNGIMMEEMEKKLRKSYSILDYRTGKLIEDNLRAVALNLGFSDYFCKSCTIKCIPDIVRLISKADTDKGPTCESLPERDKRKHAENAAVDFLKGCLYASVESAARAVLKQSKTNEFQHDVFAEAKGIIHQATQEIFEAGSTVEVEDLKHKLNKIFGGVHRLSTLTPPDDDKSAARKRKKLTEGKFMNKLKRIRWGLKHEEIALIDSRGPGILLCGAVSSVYKDFLYEGEGNSTDTAGLVNWVAKECDIFGFKELLECDFQGEVELNYRTNTAVIHCGEAKSSANDCSKGMQQMDDQARLFEFALAVTYQDKPFDNIRKKHTLFVLKSKEADKYQLQNIRSKDFTPVEIVQG